ncbi:MAG: AAA family ATPase [Phycisphaerae bacterium]|nr:MAG: AAA family ATPase [Phycisphaerae bacterium]
MSGASEIAGIPPPITVGELLKQYPYGMRITGWDRANPPEVERAFRTGYMIAAARCAESDLEAAADFEARLHSRRGDFYHGELHRGFDRWSDRRAAVLRGATQGAIEMVRARAAGVSEGIPIWLKTLRTWAAQEPIDLAWSRACPPDPPEPDSLPLRLQDIPRRLQVEVFGLWVAFPPENEHPARPLGNIERILHPDPAVRSATMLQNPSALTVRLDAVHPEAVRWLWPGRIALGKLTLLCGDPGLGKSFITLDLAARVSSGTSWPDLPLLPNSPGNVALLSAEDDLADTIRPRLDAAGADAARIVAIQAVRRVLVTGQTQDTYFDLTEDLPALEAAIRDTPDSRMVIIDPLTAYLGNTDSHKNAEVRAVLAKLFELAARTRVAVLAVTHLNKASTLPAIYRAMGSLAFVAAARAVWAVVRDENDESGRRRLFVPVKNNLGADETGLAYALEPAGAAARVVWEHGAVNIRADDALCGKRKATARGDAAEFVVATLRANGGDMLSDDLSAAAEVEGISERTLRRARQRVAESYKERGRGGRWRCKLKDGLENGLDSQYPS